MELINTDTKDKNGSENQKKDKVRESEHGDEYIKVTVSKKSETAIGHLLTKVNDGFEGGRVNRQNLMSWILVRFVDDCTDQEIKAIRADHFDEITLLELSLKRFRQAGALPPELKKILLAQAGIDDTPKSKRAKTG